MEEDGRLPTKYEGCVGTVLFQALPEPNATAAVNEIAHAVLTRGHSISNKAAYFTGILKKHSAVLSKTPSQKYTRRRKGFQTDEGFRKHFEKREHWKNPAPLARARA